MDSHLDTAVWTLPVDALILSPTVTFLWLYSAEFFKKFDHGDSMQVIDELFWTNYKITLLYFPFLNFFNYIKAPVTERILGRLVIKMVYFTILFVVNYKLLTDEDFVVNTKHVEKILYDRVDNESNYSIWTW